MQSKQLILWRDLTRLLILRHIRWYPEFVDSRLSGIRRTYIGWEEAQRAANINLSSTREQQYREKFSQHHFPELDEIERKITIISESLTQNIDIEVDKLFTILSRIKLGFNLSEKAFLIFMLLFIIQIEPSIFDLMLFAIGSEERKNPFLAFLRRLSQSQKNEELSSYFEDIGPNAPLIKRGLLAFNDDWVRSGEIPYLEMRVGIKPSVISYLLTLKMPTYLGKYHYFSNKTLYENYQYMPKKIVPFLDELRLNPEARVVFYGEKSTGRQSCLTTTFKAYGRSVIVVDFLQCVRDASFLADLTIILRDAVLYDALLLLDFGDLSDSENDDFLEKLLLKEEVSSQLRSHRTAMAIKTAYFK